MYGNSGLSNYLQNKNTELFVSTCELQDFRGERHSAGVLTLFGQLYMQPYFRNYVKEFWNTSVKNEIDNFF